MRREIVMADPDWPVDSQLVVEYVFSSPGSGEDRIFKARYANRGPYAEDI